VTWWLRAVDDTRVRIDGGGALLGRAADCDVVLPDPRASRRHALVYAAGAHAVVVSLGRGGTTIDGDDVDRERRAAPGATLAVPGATFVLERDAASVVDGPLEWVLQREGGGLVGVPRSPFVVGDASDDVAIEGWPAGALTFTVIGASLVVEGAAPFTIDERAVEVGAVERCAPGAWIALGEQRLRVLAGGSVQAGTTVSQDPGPGEPTSARLEFLPRGARLHLEDRAGRHTAYLPERRAELVALLLAPPEPHRPGEEIPDELLIDRLWPRQTKTHNDLHVLVHRVRKSLTAAGLDGVALIRREPRVGGTAFALADAASVDVE